MQARCFHCKLRIPASVVGKVRSTLVCSWCKHRLVYVPETRQEVDELTEDQWDDYLLLVEADAS